MEPNTPSFDERSDLPLAERTVLWSLRAWVASLRRPGVDVVELMAATFADLGAPACAGYLDGFMWALRHSARRTIGVNCPCQPQIDPDERLLLRVFALVQRGDRATAAALMHGMATPAGIAAACDSAALLGAELGQAGRWMKARLPRRVPGGMGQSLPG